ncbi:hypothetical protein [Altererythrobacter lutimaris]|nr:hypothetical protein [Altererythrobacter lutimaris]
MTLDTHEPISGNPLIGVQTFEVVQHTAFADGLILAIHAKRNAADQWQLISREPVDLEVCLPIPAYEAVAMIDDSESPWFAEIRGEQTESEETCFSKYLKD